MIPLVRPNPPRLSRASRQLKEIEDSGIFSNFGPVNTRFEQGLLDKMFGGVGACMTVCNATIGLMLAIRQAVTGGPAPRRFALMPSFTFAAAAQAAMWCGLTPLFCDIDPDTWAADPASEEELLRLHGDEIAVIVPYATFGYDIDLDRYETLSRQYAIPVVVDAAASLGTVSAHGLGFGAGFPGAVVYSMHATKSFATGEGGVVYSADADLIRGLRAMCNFGFGKPRVATVLGLNAKLSEVGALLAYLRLKTHDQVTQTRADLVDLYRKSLPELTFQRATGRRQAHQFVAALLPRSLMGRRDELQENLKARGVGMATYFSPHVAEQDFFREHAFAGPLPVTEDVAGRVISLPLHDTMTSLEVSEVASCVSAELRGFAGKVDREDTERTTVLAQLVPAASLPAWPVAPVGSAASPNG